MIGKILTALVLTLALFLPDAARAAGKAKETEKDLGLMMLEIPAGSFMMGSPASEKGRYSDERRHKVKISRPFLMAKTEITQEQWDEVMDEEPSFFGKCGDDCPVEKVSWEDATRFCNRLSKKAGLGKCYRGDKWTRGCTGYRLPTEAEWEYAARAGSQDAFTVGDVVQQGCGQDPKLGAASWYCGNSKVRYSGCYDASAWGGPKCIGAHPVGRKKPNAWGLYDMQGNVWEWVWDWKGDYPKGPVSDPVGPASGVLRVYRGGCWSSLAKSLRSALRFGFIPQYKSRRLGFRVARSLP